MAMTKKQQAEFDSMQAEITRLTALLQATLKSEPVERDLKKPTGNDITQGWDFNKHRTHDNIYRVWSESHRNGTGVFTKNSNGYQDGINSFSTKLLALKAWRYEVEQDALSEIAKIDEMIEVENGNS